MLLQTPLRLPAQPLNGVEALRQRREGERPQEDFARTFGGTRSSGASEQAAILHFGSRALGLARRGNDDSISDPQSDRSAVTAVAEADVTGSSAANVASTPVTRSTASFTPAPAAPSELTPEERQSVNDLRRRDREVRVHEQAHKSAGGQYAGNIRLEYRLGPDGARYAVEGAVPIDVSPVTGDPEATLRKMEIVQRAASAPASPSAADHQVGAEATRVIRQARAELAAERYAEAQELAVR